MSSSDTGSLLQLSLSDTSGVKLQILTGKTDYHRWVRDFKIIALHKGVWGLYNDEVLILTPLNEASYLSSLTPIGYPTPTTGGVGVQTRTQAATAAASTSTPKPSGPSGPSEQLQWLRFQRAEEKYEKNAKLVREANALLSY